VKVGGELRSFKGLNLPGIHLGIGAFTPRDRQCLEFAKGKKIEAVSQSFVGSAKDLHDVRNAARKLGYTPFLIAKIEHLQALDRLDEILEAADGVMVARGDLGVEIPIEQIGIVQKEIIRKANRLAKPVITATQMLESMTVYRLPTRAETTDVSNAILDGTDCVMLSGESAIGAFPVESIKMLARIAAFVEPKRDEVSPAEKLTIPDSERPSILPEHLIALSIQTSVNHLRPAAVFVSSVTGLTARRLAAMHLPVPIIAVSANERTCQNLQFSYGVIPVHVQKVPASWGVWVSQWAQKNRLPGSFAILTEKVLTADGRNNHRLEIIDL
jgi:pyruvate kinase